MSAEVREASRRDGHRGDDLVIKLVRHGQSLGNVGAVASRDVGDNTIALTPLGHEQAHVAGARIGGAFIEGALIYSSPFLRARETLAGVLEGAGLDGAQLRRYEDPRLREVDHGYADLSAQAALRQTHGAFFYRFHGGESPADCYDRTSGFLESLMRQVQRRHASRVLVITHGLTLRCFVMRFLHLSIEQFGLMANPDNCDVITIVARIRIEAPSLTCGKWAVEGLQMRHE